MIGKIQSYKIDGKTITVESTKIPIFNKKGKISNIVLFTQLSHIDSNKFMN